MHVLGKLRVMADSNQKLRQDNLSAFTATMAKHLFLMNKILATKINTPKHNAKFMENNCQKRLL